MHVKTTSGERWDEHGRRAGLTDRFELFGDIDDKVVEQDEEVFGLGTTEFSAYGEVDLLWLATPCSARWISAKRVAFHAPTFDR